MAKPRIGVIGTGQVSPVRADGFLKHGYDMTRGSRDSEAARAIEPLCILWCIPGFIQNRWTHAYEVLKA